MFAVADLSLNERTQTVNLNNLNKMSKFEQWPSLSPKTNAAKQRHLHSMQRQPVRNMRAYASHDDSLENWSPVRYLRRQAQLE